MTPRLATIRTSDGTVVCRCCVVADSAWPRAKGLLGKKHLPPDEGILLRPASSIHMFFMRFAIDAVYLDRDLTVLKVVHDLKPWRMSARFGAHAVLELAAGTCAAAGVTEGDRLVVDGPARAQLTLASDSESVNAADGLRR